MKHRVTFLILAVMLVFSMLPTAVFAAEGDMGFDGDFGWRELGDGTVTVQSYSGTGGDIIIPKQLSGKDVTEIAPGAFNSNPNIISVTVPEGVTYIGFSAFANCDALATVTLPSTLESIGDLAFAGCSALTLYIVYSKTVVYGTDVFDGCVGFQTRTFFGSTTDIYLSAYWKVYLYTVAFDAQGGSAVDSVTETSDENINTSPSTTRTGYIFGGWYETPACDTTPVSFPYPIRSITLYAKWDPIRVTSVTLNSTAETLTDGDTVTLMATVLPNDATYPEVSWTSSDDSVATVDTSGNVTAVDVGSATITAAADGQSDTCTVTVNPKRVTSVTFSSTSETLAMGDAVTLIATVLPNDATYPEVSWISSDESVATVDTSGEVTTVGLGSTTITATADGKSDTCTVTVNPKRVTSVTLSSTSETLAMGDAVTLNATVLPNDATYPEVSWTSSDESVATVNTSGEVTAVSIGSTTITATADGKSDTCTVTVQNILDFYNAYDVGKLQAFLEQESADEGVKNGTKLNPAYDVNDPRTWTGVMWDSSSPKRLQAINFYNKSLGGSLDLNGCTSLETINCAHGELETLDVSGCSALLMIVCLGNDLTAIDISGCNVLDWFDCSYNELTSLDVSSYTALTRLDCSHNELTTLVINTALVYLDCANNALTALDVRPATGLIKFDCTYNPLRLMDAALNGYDISLTAAGNGYVGLDYVDDPFEGITMIANATPNDSTAFVNWTGSSVSTYSYYHLADDSNHALTANFDSSLVMFDRNGGDTDADPSTAIVVMDGSASAPATAPTRVDYLFDGWYTEAACTNAWDFENDTVSDNITLYAKWSPIVRVTSVTLDSTSETLNVGDTVTLAATVLPNDATYPEVTWTSSDESVATVDESGKVTAVSLGSAVITAVADGQSNTCAVTVNPKRVTSVLFCLDEYTIPVGAHLWLSVEVLPNDATYPELTYESSDEGIATVDASGNIIAVGEGDAVISATADGKTGYLNLTVEPVRVTSVTLSVESKNMFVGETTTLTATVLPLYATYPEVTWTSSDESVATVDESGEVTAVGLGSATITAAADGKSDTCAVTVNPKHVTSVTLSSITETLTVGETVTLTATVLPNGATYPEVTWTSSEPDIVTVDQDGKVTAISVGSATISAEADGKTGVCEITVSAATQQRITVTGTLLDEDGNPLAGYTVELHSTPRVVVTDAAGKYTFTDVEIEDHTLIVKNTGGETMESFAVSIEQGDSFDWTDDGSGNIDVTVQNNTAQLEITIEVDDSGDVTVDDVGSIANPQTGGGEESVWFWIGMIGIVLAVCALLVWRKCTSAKA